MEVIGHQKILKFLQRSAINNQLAHSYLFYGPKHIGKNKVAEVFVSNLFCLNKKKNSFLPCGTCTSCQQLLKKIHPDFIYLGSSFSSFELTPQGKIGVEQTRQIKEFLYSSPFSAQYKVVIIEETDNLTLPAANALLKLLEEPPLRSIIILISRSFTYLPATLRSRCQVLRFSFPLKEEIIKFLKQEFFLKEEKAKEILGLAIGRPGLAIQFAQNFKEIEQERSLINDFISLLSKNDSESKFRLVDLILNTKKSPQQTLNNLTRLLRDLILVKLNLCPADKSISIQLRDLAQKYTQKDLQNLINQIFKTQLLLAANVNQKLAIENLLINQ
ncbi:hypothetical protein KKG58_01565 [Patescibacteria group bacterium]|nr:hypothetical protein [Patescibacteria group bacterium]